MLFASIVMAQNIIDKMKTKKVDWKKRYYNLRRKYKKLQNENVELGITQQTYFRIRDAMR